MTEKDFDSIIKFEDVSFSYFDEENDFEEINDSGMIIENKVFTDLTIKIPSGITSLIGQNGTGKTTFMLLSSGLLLPKTGKIFINNVNTIELEDENKRQQYSSFVYQNMEFETEEDIITLLRYVYKNGYSQKINENIINELIKVFELNNILNKKTQEISKGEMQRVIMVFSLLYGTKIIFMDEPVFALENYQKHNILSYLYNYAKKNGITIIYSIHELELSEKYSDNLLIFYKDKNPKIGKTSTLFTKENIEDAYEAPMSMLKHRESFYREGLQKP